LSPSRLKLIKAARQQHEASFAAAAVEARQVAENHDQVPWQRKFTGSQMA